MSVRWYGEIAEQKAHQAANVGLRLGAEYLLAKANETVPYLDGILEQSGTVDAGDLEAVVSYGGSARDYAVVQHERLDFHHPGKGRAKWLELALIENREQIMQVVAKAMRSAFK